MRWRRLSRFSARRRPRTKASRTDRPGIAAGPFLLPASISGKLRVNRPNCRRTPMDIVPIGPGFAAELRGVTLTDVAASDEAYAKVRSAFEEHSVLLFRGQDVTDE